MLGISWSTGKGLLRLMRCKQWDCVYCAKINRWQWINDIAGGIEVYEEKGETWYAVTITHSANLRGEQSCLWHLPVGWKKLRQRLARRVPELHYAFVPEHNLDSSVHIHMLVNVAMTQHQWHDHAHATGFGYKALAVPVYGKPGAIWYMTKYFVKQVAGFPWPRNFHRVRTTVRWPKREMDAEPGEITDWNWRYVGHVEQARAREKAVELSKEFEVDVSV
jgi:hypothetical protein